MTEPAEAAREAARRLAEQALVARIPTIPVLIDEYVRDVLAAGTAKDVIDAIDDLWDRAYVIDELRECAGRGWLTDNDTFDAMYPYQRLKDELPSLRARLAAARQGGPQ